MEQGFKLGQISERFHELARHLIAKFEDNEGLDTQCDNIRQALEGLREEKLLRIAFIGQYSAGKSTIIMALTGDRGIKIDSNIATDTVTAYEWNGNLLVDTPGLWTDRQDHDQITYEAIKNCDLLVYVITSDLFDRIILDNFIKLAYGQGYKSKMMLVVNKMGAESGDYDELVENYTASLEKALAPYSLSDFPVAFIDAADYLDGLDEDDEELREMSCFSSFINHLNQFVDDKGLLGKLDTPIRSVISEIDSAVLAAGGQGNPEFFQVLSRIEKRVIRSQKSAENDCRLAIAKLRHLIISKGNELAAQVGDSDVAFDEAYSRVQLELEKEINQANEELEQALLERQDELAQDIKEVFQSDLGEYYLHQVNLAGGISGGAARVSRQGYNTEDIKAMTRIVGKAAPKAVQFFTKTGTQGAQELLKAGQVAGSQGHQIVVKTGHLFGVKFKPWQAVKISQRIGNLLKVLGPIMAGVSAVLEFVDVKNQKQQVDQLIQARNQCSAEFIGIANDIEKQFLEAFQAYNREFYVSVLNQIAQARENAIAAEKRASKFVDEISVIRKQLTDLIDAIYS